MEGLIPLVYRAIVEYRRARQVALGSFLVVADQFSDDPRRCCYAASLSPPPPPPARARAALVSPLLRSAPGHHRA
ncbi:hypothetical protein ABZP36_000538, partial [Zizania latifolia]